MKWIIKYVGEKTQLYLIEDLNDPDSYFKFDEDRNVTEYIIKDSRKQKDVHPVIIHSLFRKEGGFVVKSQKLRLIWSAFLNSENHSLSQREIIDLIASDCSNNGGSSWNEIIREIKKHLGGIDELGKKSDIIIAKDGEYSFKNSAILKLRKPYLDDFFTTSLSFTPQVTTFPTADDWWVKNAIADFIDPEASAKICFFCGAEGCGRSSCLTKYASYINEIEKDYTLIACFAGSKIITKRKMVFAFLENLICVKRDPDFIDLLSLICSAFGIQDKKCFKDTIDLIGDELLYKFFMFALKLSDKKIIIILDSIDNCDKAGKKEILEYLIELSDEIPFLKIIISTGNTKEIRPTQNDRINEIDLSAFDEYDREICAGINSASTDAFYDDLLVNNPDLAEIGMLAAFLKKAGFTTLSADVVLRMNSVKKKVWLAQSNGIFTLDDEKHIRFPENDEGRMNTSAGFLRTRKITTL